MPPNIRESSCSRLMAVMTDVERLWLMRLALGDTRSRCCRKFRHVLKARGRRPEASRSLEERSVRYMELFRTSLDLIHTYGTHVNMSVRTGRPCAVSRKASSSGPRRSSGRPRHQERGTFPCVSRGARNRRPSNHPHPTRHSHTRPAERSLPSLRRSRRTARARNRRCDATT